MLETGSTKLFKFEKTTGSKLTNIHRVARVIDECSRNPKWQKSKFEGEKEERKN
jgi:hypothetical protein